MDFREFFLAYEQALKGIKVILSNPIVPSKIPEKGFRDGGGAGLKFWLPPKLEKPKAYQPFFRKPKSM
jgi:hypothetical protein